MEGPIRAPGCGEVVQERPPLAYPAAVRALAGCFVATARLVWRRRPVAREVMAMTHIVFWAEASLGPVPSALRGRLAPLAAPLVPAVIGRRRLVAEAVRLFSQLGVGYRHSPLSVEGTPRRGGGPRAGDRLPDQLVSSAGRTVRLHDLLARPGVHLLLDRDADPLGTLPPSRFVSIHRLTSSPGRGLIAVRPDGYIGFRCRTTEIGQLAAWLARLRAGAADGNHPDPLPAPAGTGCLAHSEQERGGG